MCPSICFQQSTGKEQRFQRWFYIRFYCIKLISHSLATQAFTVCPLTRKFFSNWIWNHTSSFTWIVKQRDDSDTETREQEALKTPTHNRLNIRSLLVVLLFDSHTQFDKLCLLFTLLCEKLCYGCGNGFFALLSSWVWAWNCRYPFCFDLFNTHTHTLMKYETQKHEMKLGSHRVKCMFICIDFQSNHQQQHTTTIKSKNHFIRSNFGFALVAALQMKYER